MCLLCEIFGTPLQLDIDYLEVSAKVLEKSFVVVEGLSVPIPPAQVFIGPSGYRITAFYN